MSIFVSSLLKTSINYQLNDSRVNRILNAKTLDEASKMGIWDHIKDFFRGGAKQESIRELYDKITSADNPYDTQPLRMVNRFAMLRSFAKEEHQSKFCVEVESSSDEQWNYQLKVGKDIVFQSDALNKDKSEHFYEVSTLAHCIWCENQYLTFKDSGDLSLDSYIQARIECMSDDKGIQNDIKERLDDPRFSKSEFIEIKSHKEDDKFIAAFKTGELILSNRKTEKNEFRGDILKDIIKNSEFNNLKDLLIKDYGTESDQMLLYMATAIKGFLENILENPDSLYSEEVLAIAYSRQVANTSVGALWQLRAPNLQMTGIMTDNPNKGFLLKYIDGFIKKTDVSWASRVGNSQELQLDQEARRKFNREILTNQVVGDLSAEDKMKMLENMEGAFGSRLRGVVEFAAEQVGMNEDDSKRVSTAYKYSPFMEDLIITLREQLGMEDVVIKECEYVNKFSELSRTEIRSLSMVNLATASLE